VCADIQICENEGIPLVTRRAQRRQLAALKKSWVRNMF
jgi:hypothetical protein